MFVNDFLCDIGIKEYEERTPLCSTSVNCNMFSNQLSYNERVRMPCVFRKQSGVLSSYIGFAIYLAYYNVHTKFA